MPIKFNYLCIIFFIMNLYHIDFDNLLTNQYKMED